MNKYQKEVLQHQLDAEKAILDKLTKQYQMALWDIDVKIRVLQSDELTQSKIYRIQYQKALKKQVEAILEKLHADEYTTIQQFLSDTYTDAFVGAAYDMHGQGVPLILPIDRNAAVKAVVTDSQISEGLYESLGVDTKKLKNSISAEITRGIASGLAHSQIAQNIAAAAKAPLGRAKTIVRTESHRIAQASAMDAQKVAVSKGAKVVKQWMSTLDGKTRHSHRRLDGQIREVDEYFEIDGKKAKYPGDFGDPAEDCNCRCQLLQRARIALDKDELKALRERAVRHSLYVDDPAAFRAEKLPALKNFEEFKKSYLKAAETIDLPLEKDGKSDIINSEEMYKKASDSRKDFKFISQERFDSLTIEAVKKGAIILRGTPEVEKHLMEMDASASSLGGALMFMKDVCVSEVLEETYHYMQDLRGLNDDKEAVLRTILNEIDAKQYILDNAQKYKVPRNELDLIQKQLEGYKKQLEEYEGE